jgi:hypothetical protein
MADLLHDNQINRAAYWLMYKFSIQRILASFLTAATYLKNKSRTKISVSKMTTSHMKMGVEAILKMSHTSHISQQMGSI